jgi:hypothetical protein
VDLPICKNGGGTGCLSLLLSTPPPHTHIPPPPQPAFHPSATTWLAITAYSIAGHGSQICNSALTVGDQVSHSDDFMFVTSNFVEYSKCLYTLKTVLEQCSILHTNCACSMYLCAVKILSVKVMRLNFKIETTVI